MKQARDERPGFIIRDMQRARLKPREITRLEQVSAAVRRRSEERWLDESRHLQAVEAHAAAVEAYRNRPGWLRRFLIAIGRVW